ncbi:MAG: hypothetical protein IPI31_07125 [Bacteroidetes bacterium]|jgi:hypothetical protein|nr:hypothetical protein [Bacteroidota bacterium]MBK7567589.1 hypothetical protein [Bacteroidota bacterium]
MRIIYFSILLFAIANFSNCKESLNPNTSRLIDSPGEYFNPNLGVKTKVSISDYDVTVELFDNKNILLFRNDTLPFSSVHVWGIFMESNGDVWIESSDYGLVLCQYGEFPNPNYTPIDYNLDSQSIERIPKEIWEIIPNSTKKNL